MIHTVEDFYNKVAKDLKDKYFASIEHSKTEDTNYHNYRKQLELFNNGCLTYRELISKLSKYCVDTTFNIHETVSKYVLSFGSYKYKPTKLKQNTLYCKRKIVLFNYQNETFRVDLAEGDLHDSWNGITLKNGDVKDFNFSWEKNDSNHKPNVTLYEVDSDNQTNFFNYDVINFDKIIGTKEQYFGTEKDTYIVTNIDYDAPSNIKKQLPTTFKIQVYQNCDDIDEYIGDAITKETGYCHFGFSYSIK